MLTPKKFIFKFKICSVNAALEMWNLVSSAMTAKSLLFRKSFNSQFSIVQGVNLFSGLMHNFYKSEERGFLSSLKTLKILFYLGSYCGNNTSKDLSGFKAVIYLKQKTDPSLVATKQLNTLSWQDKKHQSWINTTMDKHLTKKNLHQSTGWFTWMGSMDSVGGRGSGVWEVWYIWGGVGETMGTWNQRV